MVKCLRCGAETVEGEAFISVESQSTPMAGGMMSMPGMSMGNVGMTTEERLRWREKTGEKKGFIFKSDEVRTMVVRGRRCPECGYIELYAGENIKPAT
jgi:predicted nucleic-acid-binding Zn-ribbon protein